MFEILYIIGKNKTFAFQWESCYNEIPEFESNAFSPTPQVFAVIFKTTSLVLLVGAFHGFML